MELLQKQTGLVCRQVLGHGAFAVDTLTPWFPFRPMYAFPSLQSLPHLCCRMAIEGTLVIHITPNWPKRSWYLTRLLADAPWEVVAYTDLPSHGPVFQTLHLTAWLLMPGS